MSYFLIRSGEDGTRIQQLTEKQLLQQIEPDENGDYYYGAQLEFLKEIPESDKGFWIDVNDNAAVLIKGEIVVPKQKTVVQRYELE